LPTLGFWQAIDEVLAEDTSATLLGAQNRECLEQATKEPAGQGQARP